MVANRGKIKEGVSVFRINATMKEDLNLIIKEETESVFKFWKKPIIEKPHKTYSVFITAIYSKRSRLS